jgi:uncharacterized protein (TIGR00730 family)
LNTVSAVAPFTLCVYCGSRHGDDPAFTVAAQEVGRQVGQRGWRLVYGGGKVGLMGEVANAALAAGAQVVGILPERLRDREVGHTGLSELQIVPTMHERKQRMAAMASAFLALPGGIGTLEELFEVWTWRQIGYHDQPLGLLNTQGYFDPLLSFLDRSVDAGFLAAGPRNMLSLGQNVSSLLDDLAAQNNNATRPDDFRLI